MIPTSLKLFSLSSSMKEFRVLMRKNGIEIMDYGHDLRDNIVWFFLQTEMSKDFIKFAKKNDLMNFLDNNAKIYDIPFGNDHMIYDKIIVIEFEADNFPQFVKYVGELDNMRILAKI
jgi:hypothetical protein